MKSWLNNKVSGQNLGKKQDINSLKGPSSVFLLITKEKKECFIIEKHISYLLNQVKINIISKKHINIRQSLIVGSIPDSTLTGHNKYTWYSYPKYTT